MVRTTTDADGVCQGQAHDQGAQAVATHVPRSSGGGCLTPAAQMEVGVAAAAGAMAKTNGDGDLTAIRDRARHPEGTGATTGHNHVHGHARDLGGAAQYLDHHHNTNNNSLHSTAIRNRS